MAPSSSTSTPSKKDPKQTSNKTKRETPLERASHSEHFSHSEFAKLVVGTEKKEFFVHTSLLCNESKFFRSCLQSGFAEATSSTVNVCEEKPSTVQPFVQWLYTGAFQGPYISKELVLVFKYADMIGAEQYCNDIADAVRMYRRKSKKYPSLHGLAQFYEAGLGESTLAQFSRKLLAHRLAQKHSGRQRRALVIEEIRDRDVPSEVKLDLTIELLEYTDQEWSDPKETVGCCFHTHVVTNLCEGAGDAAADGK